jgi:3-oxoacyl-[acyl-carrier protein] reductase
MKDRVVLITGSSRGLGRAMAIRFGKAGAKVAVAYLVQKAAAEETARLVETAGGRTLIHALDVRSAESVDRLVEKILKQWDRLDVLIHSAGVTADAPLIKMTEAQWDEVVETHLTGAFLCMKRVGRVMQEQQEGQIVNILSWAGRVGRAGQANYAAAKAGLAALTKTAAMEWGRYNIRVNAVVPGFMETDMTQPLTPSQREAILAENLIGRSAGPEEAAEFVYRLCESLCISGQVFQLDSRIT